MTNDYLTANNRTNLSMVEHVKYITGKAERTIIWIEYYQSNTNKLDNVKHRRRDKFKVVYAV